MKRDPASRVTRCARLSLTALAVTLPFEAPLTTVGPLTLTSVEVALYVTLAAWGVVLSVDVITRRGELASAVRPLWRDPLARATMLYAFGLLSSAIAAPSFRDAALKFALRSLSGIFLFFAARRLTRGHAAARSVIFALVVGGLLSSVTALVEAAFPASDGLWIHFRELSFDTFGLRRASGAFAYPTIGAMYWEAMVPLVIVAPFLRRSIALVSLATLFAAILASATRSALAGSALGCVALFVSTRSWNARLGRVATEALGTLVVTCVAAIAVPGPGSLLGQRLRWWEDTRWFGVTYDAPNAPRVVENGETFSTEVTLRNTGTLTWQADGPHPMRLVSHWYLAGRSRDLVQFDGLRNDLAADVLPQASVSLAAVARAPDSPGRYRLAWDVVQEDVTWFSEHGNAMPEEPIEVRASTGSHAPAPRTLVRRTQAAPPSRPALWRAATILWREAPLLGVGPDNFRRRYEDVLSPAPTGERYEDTRIHANSLYFETLADLGAIGLVALGLLAVALLRVARDRLAERDVLRLGAAVSAGLFFVHGASDCFLEFTPTLALFWVALGLASSGGEARSDTPA